MTRWYSKFGPLSWYKRVVIMSDAAGQLAEAFLFFHDRDKRKKESVGF